MAKFKVVVGHDAWAKYATVVEAKSAKDAEAIVGDPNFEGVFIFDGTSEFDDSKILTDHTVELPSDYAPEEVTDYSLTDEELATVLAALRLWKNEQDGESPDDAMLEDIATNGGRHPKLGSEAIDDLCERLNCA